MLRFVRDDDGSYLYGDHSDVELTIRVALRMKCGEQIKNSFWHEVFHAFYYNNRQDESLAQTFANFMCEFELTRE